MRETGFFIPILWYHGEEIFNLKTLKAPYHELVFGNVIEFLANIIHLKGRFKVALCFLEVHDFFQRCSSIILHIINYYGCCVLQFEKNIHDTDQSSLMPAKWDLKPKNLQNLQKSEKTKIGPPSWTWKLSWKPEQKRNLILGKREKKR